MSDLQIEVMDKLREYVKECDDQIARIQGVDFNGTERLRVLHHLEGAKEFTARLLGIDIQELDML